MKIDTRQWTISLHVKNIITFTLVLLSLLIKSSSSLLITICVTGDGTRDETRNGNRGWVYGMDRGFDLKS